MLELRELHLELAFVTVGALRKDIENEADTIDNPAVQAFFEIPLLRRRQLMIENRKLGAAGRKQRRKLLHFAGAGKKGGVGPPSLALQHCGDTDARAQCELHQFGGRFSKVLSAEIEADQYRLGTAPGTFKHQ